MEKARVSKSGVYYLHFGAGEPLVLIHGLGEVKEGWHNQYELADQYELIIPDLRGHGESTKMDGISIENFASDVISLLQELQIENAHILGLSMGGAVAQEIYRQAPDLCRSLMLVSTFHYFPQSLKNLLFKNRKRRYLSLETPKRQLNEVARISLYSWKDENIEKFSLYFRPKQNSFLLSLKSCFEVNNLSLLPAIKVPTLIIGGQYDAVVPVWIQFWMHRLIPHSEFIIMRNTGHIAKLEANDRFNLVLRNFLNRQQTAV
ncbi:alpha/beta fold hydrolase [Neobacillus massiliamazoniensis]|jgi:pimeloyl-ACP methyl ester carboxylesterase|uniref:Alpha/beta hydrolase fold protein n=1 Tax=Neobacillus massiliamazoniensis TaxID=1499688 RepID=A0A0U1NSJ8_9BACI|nr:alpha/beta hydrolase [Neobacillus massiliamazoniensis]CRK80712.1 alpha/beta hydrolase fold protein [Neobacillus massiliamazoniensis]